LKKWKSIVPKIEVMEKVRISIIRSKTIYFLFTFIALSIISCNEKSPPTGTQFEITWEVISNTFKETPAVKAAFTIENHSDVTLDSNNWMLYFNQMPRDVLNQDTLDGTKVERISSDWYRIVPLEGFVLTPGQKTTVVYEAEDWWIKESDAPMGLYFVFTGEDGNETIVVAENYTILPFERAEQITRHLNEGVPLPSAAQTYSQNLLLKKLSSNELLPIIPSPYKTSPISDSVFFDKEPAIYYARGLAFEAEYLKKYIDNLCQCNIKTIEGSSEKENVIDLQFDDVSLGWNPEEAYTLEISNNNHISLKGTDKAGVFYAVQSLIALVEPGTTAGQGFSMPVLSIEDAPRFGYRGVQIDLARNFQTVEALKKTIDILAYYKINTLHLHLTDDEGWRIAIDALPELTEVGGQRGHTTKSAAALHPAYGSGPHPYAEGSFGSGFYTHDEYVDLLRYAHQRHISVIPEINLPGHARAAIKAMEARFQRLTKQGKNEEGSQFRLIEPEETSKYSSAQYYTDNVVNVALESVYLFVEVVLDELVEMYKEAGAPLEIVHIGGDEVPRGAWTESPAVSKVIAENPEIGSPANMHAYFTTRALAIFKKHDLKMAGWEEVALKTNPDRSHVPNPHFSGGRVIPFVWNNLGGSQDLAYRLANRGFPVVLSHVTAFYFDLAYNNDPREPGLYWGGFVNTKSAWHFNPFDVFKTTTHDNMGHKIDIEIEYKDMERLRPDAQKNVLGLQAQLWGETIRGSEMLQYYLLPKLAGFAQSAWSRERIWETTVDESLRQQQVDEQWNIFANTLGQRELPRLASLFGGFHYRVPLPGAVVKNGVLSANVEFPGLEIRFTTNDADPTLNSTLYTEPVNVGNQLVKLAAFDLAGNRSRVVTITHLKQE
jgi:hexosaminidase